MSEETTYPDGAIGALGTSEKSEKISRISLTRSPSRAPTIVSPTKSPVPSIHAQMSPSLEEENISTQTPTPPTRNTPVPSPIPFASEKELLSYDSSSSSQGPQLAVELSAARRRSLLHGTSFYEDDASSDNSLRSRTISNNESFQEEDHILVTASEQALIKKRPSLMMYTGERSQRLRGIDRFRDAQPTGPEDAHTRTETTSSSAKLIGPEEAGEKMRRSHTTSSRPTQFSIQKGTDNIPLKAIQILGPELEMLRRQQGGIPASIVEDSDSVSNISFEGNAAGEGRILRSRSVEEDHDAISPFIRSLYNGNGGGKLSFTWNPTPSRHLPSRPISYDSSASDTAEIGGGLHSALNSGSITGNLPSLPAVGSTRRFALMPRRLGSRNLMAKQSGVSSKSNGLTMNPSIDLNSMDMQEVETIPENPAPHPNLQRTPSFLTALGSHPPDPSLLPTRSMTVPARRRRISIAPSPIDTKQPRRWESGKVVSTPYPTEVGSANNSERAEHGELEPDRHQAYCGRREKKSLPVDQTSPTTTHNATVAIDSHIYPSLTPIVFPTPDDFQGLPILLTVAVRNRATNRMRSTKVHVPSQSGRSSGLPCDDEALARSIRAAYTSLDGYWRSRRSLWRIVGVRVIQSRYSTSRNSITQSPFPSEDLDLEMALSSIISTSEMTDLLLHPEHGRSKTAWLEWARAPSCSNGTPAQQSTQSTSTSAAHHRSVNEDPGPGQQRTIEILTAPSPHKILVVLYTVVLLSIGAALLWMFFGVGGGAAFEPSTTDIGTASGIGLGLSDMQIESAGRGVSGAPARVAAGIALGVWVLLLGWGGMLTWAGMGWMAG